MGRLIQTAVGLVDEDGLDYQITEPEDGENHRKIYMQWRLKADHPSGAKAGEIVRQDCGASILRGIGAAHEVGKMG